MSQTSQIHAKETSLPFQFRRLAIYFVIAVSLSVITVFVAMLLISSSLLATASTLPLGIGHVADKLFLHRLSYRPDSLDPITMDAWEDMLCNKIEKGGRSQKIKAIKMASLLSSHADLNKLSQLMRSMWLVEADCDTRILVLEAIIASCYEEEYGEVLAGLLAVPEKCEYVRIALYARLSSANVPLHDKCELLTNRLFDESSDIAKDILNDLITQNCK